MSLNAYERAATRAESPRETEYRALLAVTRELERVDQDDIAAYFRALHDNLRVWLIFQASLVEGTPIQDDKLRANLISLSIWVEKHTRLCQRREADVQALIEVNRAIMEGLVRQSGNPSGGQAYVPSSSTSA